MNIDSWNKFDVSTILEPIVIFIPEAANKNQIFISTSSDGSQEFVKERIGEISEAIDKNEEDETLEPIDEVQALTEGVAVVEIGLFLIQ